MPDDSDPSYPSNPAHADNPTKVTIDADGVREARARWPGLNWSTRNDPGEMLPLRGAADHVRVMLSKDYVMISVFGVTRPAMRHDSTFDDAAHAASTIAADIFDALALVDPTHALVAERKRSHDLANALDAAWLTLDELYEIATEDMGCVVDATSIRSVIEHYRHASKASREAIRAGRVPK